MSPPWGIWAVVCFPPWRTCKETTQTFLHPAADWAAQTTIWEYSRDAKYYCESVLNVELLLLLLKLFKIVALLFCGLVFTEYIIFILLQQVTVDNATLQAMQGIENASVSQDALGNTTIIYEQGWHYCHYLLTIDICVTSGDVCHIWHFSLYAP